jgi:hypothetical protein
MGRQMAKSNLELKELLRCSKKEGNTDAKADKFDQMVCSFKRR